MFVVAIGWVLPSLSFLAAVRLWPPTIRRPSYHSSRRSLFVLLLLLALLRQVMPADFRPPWRLDLTARYGHASPPHPGNGRGSRRSMRRGGDVDDIAQNEDNIARARFEAQVRACASRHRGEHRFIYWPVMLPQRW